MSKKEAVSMVNIAFLRQPSLYFRPYTTYYFQRITFDYFTSASMAMILISSLYNSRASSAVILISVDNEGFLCSNLEVFFGIFCEAWDVSVKKDRQWLLLCF